MQRLFECEGDVPVKARGWCSHLRIAFNGMPRDAESMKLAEARGTYRRLDTPQYAAMVRGCRAFLCTRSPADLVSPRYFECMLSRTLVIAERNAAHGVIFSQGSLIEFGDEGEFESALLSALESPGMERMLDVARAEALTKHTWERRVGDLLATLKKKTHRRDAESAEKAGLDKAASAVCT